ncbi:uncharacterized protein LOC131246126 isoform X1 [Magnolia sinica]|uniref:uncharacterized protein LOC131246126 isoform X1 n=1 Tax=Magnolia sinica TaxID=86752 RepID=UPI002659883C|nr:uncharacterized protein LOC131246126 isoform X1 [Magnolia sinica]XP_058101995.1 uncharacterized protein LOC131246126 isoform X1 [Magnolia sinica]
MGFGYLGLDVLHYRFRGWTQAGQGQRRSREVADAANSTMVGVIELDSEKVQLLCDAANEEVDEKNKDQIANFLCPGNYVVSGGVKAVEAKAKSFKARMMVNCS